MKIHYFQRYLAKENVATANTMLLLSRLYQYSSDKFFRFLKSEFFSDSFEPEIVFNLQEKSFDSIPDATITQESFKIVVETKMSDWFYSEQLMRHLNSFSDEKYEVEFGELTEERKQKIADAIIDGVQHGYDIKSSKHRYFFVEKFHETDFKKITPRAPMGTRVFDLTQILETEQLPETEDIAELLKTKTWS